jgi:hypothetical protein
VRPESIILPAHHDSVPVQRDNWFTPGEPAGTLRGRGRR